MTKEVHLEHAITVPCGTCGAPLRLDVASARVHCDYCRAFTPFSGATLERARRHLAELETLEEAAADAAAEADYQKRRRRLGWRWLQPLFPLFLGFFVIFALGVGVSAQFVVVPALTPLFGPEPAGIVGGILALCLWGAILASVFALRARRRRVALPKSAVEIGRLACGACGASVPVVYGRATACPCCGAHLLDSESARAGARSVAERVLEEQKGEAAAARERAERAHAGETESTAAAVLSNQLLLIGFAIAVGVIVGIAKLLFHV